ncbi:hypothetical protein COU59_01010 [Candidatus Pacearchaeota archaeon CG10_big_fil_rev_8_21_14_0_10_34_12]|nr:MAG: hypothetical protein COU59_01010 [Candidatus Pacearchaeota archaeon CG10_big_fil_rev_8_21_14_0_10_34_12]
MNSAVDKSIALLYGIMLGDGCLSYYTSRDGKKHFVISITGSYNDDLPFFEKILVPLVENIRGKTVKIIKRESNGRIDLNFHDKELFNYFKGLGFIVGKKGPSITIPKIFYEKNLIRHIIQGFFATDGSLVLTKNPNKFYPRLEIHTIHKYLMSQAHSYLVSIGMKGHIYDKKSKPDPRWKTFQQQYRFQFNGKENLLIFEKLIGFVNPKHHEKFVKFLRYDRQYNKAVHKSHILDYKQIRESINIEFTKKMAAPGVEPGTSAS